MLYFETVIMVKSLIMSVDVMAKIMPLILIMLGSGTKWKFLNKYKFRFKLKVLVEK